MSTVNRSEFLQHFGQGQMDINNLSPEAQDLVERAGIQPEQLRKVAGADGIITGGAEARVLYSLVEEYDQNGTMRSLGTGYTTSDGEQVLSASGELYQAFKGEVVARQRDAQLRGPAGEMGSGNVRKRGSLEGMTTSDDIATAKTKLTGAGFTDIHIKANTVYFGQGGKFGHMKYPRTPPKPGENRDLVQAGCGPTSMSIIDATLRPSANTTPKNVANFAINQGLSGSYDPKTRATESTSVRQLVRKWSKTVGLEPKPFEIGKGKNEVSGKKAVNAIRDEIKAGGLALVSVGPGHFTEGGHIMTINGTMKDKNGVEWFLVANPGKQYPEKVRYKKGVVVENTLAHGAGKVRVTRAVLEAQLKYGFTFAGENQS